MVATGNEINKGISVISETVRQKSKKPLGDIAFLTYRCRNNDGDMVEEQSAASVF